MRQEMFLRYLCCINMGASSFQNCTVDATSDSSGGDVVQTSEQLMCSVPCLLSWSCDLRQLQSLHSGVGDTATPPTGLEGCLRCALADHNEVICRKPACASHCGGAIRCG